jgi:hypothetical protein
LVSRQSAVALAATSVTGTTPEIPGTHAAAAETTGTHTTAAGTETATPPPRRANSSSVIRTSAEARRSFEPMPPTHPK